MDHRAEGGAAFEFGRGPGVPVADRGDGAGEVDFVHGPGNTCVARAVGVGPVPEEAALLDNHDDECGVLGVQ